MNIRPLYDRIVVKRLEEEADKTAGGLFIPDSAKEKPQQGEVVAVGQGKRADDGKHDFFHMAPQSWFMAGFVLWCKKGARSTTDVSDCSGLS